MQIAIFADIHGNYEALETILKDIENRKIDNIICLGDVIGRGFNSRECLETVLNNPKIEMCLGNHEVRCINGEEYLPNEESEICDKKVMKKIITDDLIEKLKAKPLVINKKIGNNNIMFYHYPVKNNNFIPLQRYISEDAFNINNANITIFGHIHKHVEKKIGNNIYVALDTAGYRKDNLTNYMILDVNEYSYSMQNIELEYKNTTQDVYKNRKWGSKFAIKYRY